MVKTCRKVCRLLKITLKITCKTSFGFFYCKSRNSFAYTNLWKSQDLSPIFCLIINLQGYLQLFCKLSTVIYRLSTASGPFPGGVDNPFGTSPLFFRVISDCLLPAFPTGFRSVFPRLSGSGKGQKKWCVERSTHHFRFYNRLGMD